MLADLHIHTTCSDGIYSPQEIINLADKAELKAIAITDHDNTSGYIETKKALANSNSKLKLISGVEIDTTGINDLTVHVLGYHYDPSNKELADACQWMRDGRVVRIKKMVAKLQEFKFDISYEDVKAVAGDSNAIGRPHVARALIKKGYFTTTQEVFDELIAQGKKAYVKQEKLTPKEAVQVLHNAGGIAVMAHPAEVKMKEKVEEILTDSLFDGLEIWHPSATKLGQIDEWKALASKLGLLKSGGSDFHGDRYPKSLGEYKVFYKDVINVIEYK